MCFGWRKTSGNFFTCYDAILECTRHFVPMFSYVCTPGWRHMMAYFHVSTRKISDEISPEWHFWSCIYSVTISLEYMIFHHIYKEVNLLLYIFINLRDFWFVILINFYEIGFVKNENWFVIHESRTVIGSFQKRSIPPPTEEIFAVRRGRDEKCLRMSEGGGEEKCLRMSEGGRGMWICLSEGLRLW
jgi:hypothetical protein